MADHDVVVSSCRTAYVAQSRTTLRQIKLGLHSSLSGAGRSQVPQQAGGRHRLGAGSHEDISAQDRQQDVEAGGLHELEARRMPAE
jgi:hypothetical protein